MVTTNSGAQLMNFPDWVPEQAVNYLAHTVEGMSIRSVAKLRNCHPSTILRQVRRLEQRRDDPLVDAALRRLLPGNVDPQTASESDLDPMTACTRPTDDPSNEAEERRRLDRAMLAVLRRLCEPGAVLAVARDMDRAVVVGVATDAADPPTFRVDRETAQAMALKSWIVCPDPGGRVARYFITQVGREALRSLTAAEENRAQGLGSDLTIGPDGAPHPSNTRYLVTETPLSGLARRRDKSGNLFLDRALVAAGERMREDFEVADLGPAIKADWKRVLTQKKPGTPPGVIKARERLLAALEELGPGLGDVALRCCCLLEGLEVTEQQLGWSARSGKIVLRIALQRLIQHYERASGALGPMIG